MSKSVECPVGDHEKHASWCYANRAVTSDNLKERSEQPTYTRVFADEDQAKWFRFDFKLRP